MSAHTRQHHAVIQALASRLADLGHPVSAVRLPATLASDGEGEFYVPLRASNIFEHVLHVREPDDPYAIEALNQRQGDAVAQNFRSAYRHPDPATQALTCAVLDGLAAQIAPPPPSDDDLVKLIGETIDNTISFGSIRTKWFAGPEDEGIKTIATAVLSKLRAEGVIR